MSIIGMYMDGFLSFVDPSGLAADVCQTRGVFGNVINAIADYKTGLGSGSILTGTGIP